MFLLLFGRCHGFLVVRFEGDPADAHRHRDGDQYPAEVFIEGGTEAELSRLGLVFDVEPGVSAGSFCCRDRVGFSRRSVSGLDTRRGDAGQVVFLFVTLVLFEDLPTN